MHKIGLRKIFLSSATSRLKFIKSCDYILGSLVARLIPAQMPKSPPSSVERLLVIRPGGIGDAVFLLTVLKSIKLKFPQVTIDVLCQARNAAVFASQRQVINQVYDSFADLRELSQNDYDLVVDTEQWHYLSALTAYAMRTAVRIGFASRPLRQKFFNQAVHYEDDAYELENFYRLFESLICPQDLKIEMDKSFEVTPYLKNWAEARIPSNSVTLSVAASVPERELSLEQLTILAQGVSSRGFCPIFLGGKDGLKKSRQIAHALKSAEAQYFVGKTSLDETAALIKSSRIFIGTDSGLMHLAVSVGTPVIGLFGAGNIRKWMSPGKAHWAVTENAPCSPCTAYGYGLPTCRGAFPCLRAMDLEAMMDRYLERLNV